MSVLLFTRTACYYNLEDKISAYIGNIFFIFLKNQLFCTEMGLNNNQLIIWLNQSGFFLFFVDANSKSGSSSKSVLVRVTVQFWLLCLWWPPWPWFGLTSRCSQRMCNNADADYCCIKSLSPIHNGILLMCPCCDDVRSWNILAQSCTFVVKNKNMKESATPSFRLQKPYKYVKTTQRKYCSD